MLHFLLSPRYVEKADLHSFFGTLTVKPCEGRDNNAHYLHGQGRTDSMTLSAHFYGVQHVDLQVLLLSKQH